jgi:hypothetical protein
MAGISPIITDGFLFTPSLIVTAGFLSGEPVPVIALQGGHWGPKKKKKKHEPRFQPLPSAGDTLRAILDDMNEREDEEAVMMFIKRFYE